MGGNCVSEDVESFNEEGAVITPPTSERSGGRVRCRIKFHAVSAYKHTFVPDEIASECCALRSPHVVHPEAPQR